MAEHNNQQRHQQGQQRSPNQQGPAQQPIQTQPSIQTQPPPSRVDEEVASHVAAGFVPTKQAEPITLTMDADMDIEDQSDLASVIATAIEAVLRGGDANAIKVGLASWVEEYGAPSQEQVEAVMARLKGSVDTVQQQLQWAQAR